MPRLTLQSKAFIALAALLVALLLIFTGFSRLGLQRGLGPYAAEIELGRMDWLSARLERLYAEQNSWQPLRSQPERWRSLLRPDAGPPRNDEGGFDHPGRFGERPPPPPDGDFGRDDTHFAPPGERPPMPPGYAQSQRLALLDTDAKWVAGSPAAATADGAARLTLHGAEGSTIGQLVLAPPADLASEADRAFLNQQLGFVAWTGVAGLLLALLLSWWLARRWLAPIDTLVAGARGVAAGRLDTRVPVHGDDELARLAQTFNHMAEQLGGMEASRRQWIGDVAHELRTPLAAMRAEIEAVQDGVRIFDDKTALRLHRQVMRLIQLVGDLRASLDAEAGTTSTRVPLHPLALLAEAMSSMQPRFDQQQLAVGCTGLDALAAQTPPPLVLGDAQQLHRVFLNLLENSVRYTDAGGRISLSARVERMQSSSTAAQLVLQFDDTAPGVAAGELPRLFERLYRAEASRTRANGDLGGSGLGLAICRAIVQAHGGHISAEASPQGGLRVTLTLPLLENHP
jgi:two-component system sensor histidine kinase BaeS